MKTCIITGITGCVGHNLAELLLEKNVKIIGIVRTSSNLDKIKNIINDISLININKFDLNDYYDGKIDLDEDVDCCFNCAGNTNINDAENYFRDNEVFTQEIVNFCESLNVKKFIHLSTAATSGLFGQSSYIKISEETNEYVKTKRFSELAVEQSDLQYCIIKPCLIVGRYDYNNYSKIFKLIKENKVIGALPGRINFCDVDNVCRAMYQAYFTGIHKEHYILAEGNYSFKEFFDEIAKYLNINKTYKEVPLWQLYLYSFYCKIKSIFTREEPIINNSVINLLCKDAECPKIDQIICHNDLLYPEEEVSVSEMVKKCGDWLKNIGAI
jgi:dihydroflavonol-4-reductase